MTFNAKARRRWFGGLCLLAAIVMLATGNKTPGGRLDGVAFVLFWMTCFVLAVLAFVTAILDARALRLEARDEQRELLKEAMTNIDREKDKRLKSGASKE